MFLWIFSKGSLTNIESYSQQESKCPCALHATGQHCTSRLRTRRLKDTKQLPVFSNSNPNYYASFTSFFQSKWLRFVESQIIIAQFSSEFPKFIRFSVQVPRNTDEEGSFVASRGSDVSVRSTSGHRTGQSKGRSSNSPEFDSEVGYMICQHPCNLLVILTSRRRVSNHGYLR